MQTIMKTAYESIMILLVMLTIITLWTDSTYNSTINWIVWAVFFLDFLIRFITAKKKWDFIKQNPFLIIAIIPFDQFFQMARIVRLIYLFRIKTIAKYYISPYVKKFTFQSITLIVSLVLILLFAESILIWKLESSIQTYYDALAVLFGQIFFFGRQIIVIEAPISRWTLTATSILGIVIQGLAIQWAFTKAEAVFKRIKKGRASSRAS